MVHYSNRCPDMTIKVDPTTSHPARRAGRSINAALVPAAKIE
jgi:hypothetical protein